MDKAVRTALLRKLGTALREAVPSLAPYNEKSAYVWPGELVFRSLEIIPSMAVFVVVAPSKTGFERFTVELAWSTDDQFPRLAQRPSGVSADNEALLARPQAAVRLFTLGDQNANDWIEVSKETIDAAVARTTRELKEFGIPYLSRVMR